MQMPYSVGPPEALQGALMHHQNRRVFFLNSIL